MTDKQKIEMIKDAINVADDYLGSVITCENLAGYNAVLEVMMEFIKLICNK